jgi:phenylalanyl-tRNA synthetase beta chain
VGEDLRRHLDLDDRVLTLKLTPNRADCLSLEGVAREVAALTGAPATYIQAEEVPVAIASERAVVLDAPAACPRYCGRVIAGVDATAATPSWMRRRLERSGLRPISALVDITNYVMLELGQPLHAFDNQRLAGAVHARMAQCGRDDQAAQRTDRRAAERRPADCRRAAAVGDGGSDGRRG